MPMGKLELIALLTANGMRSLRHNSMHLKHSPAQFFTIYGTNSTGSRKLTPRKLREPTVWHCGRQARVRLHTVTHTGMSEDWQTLVARASVMVAMLFLFGVRRGLPLPAGFKIIIPAMPTWTSLALIFTVARLQVGLTTLHQSWALVITSFTSSRKAHKLVALL